MIKLFFSESKMALAIVCRSIQSYRVFEFFKIKLNFFNEKNIKNVPISAFSIMNSKYFCTEKKLKTQSKLSNPTDPEKTKKRKPLTSPQITLILPEETVVSETLECAEKLAKRRDLKLVKIIDFDTKTEKPLYKLMTNRQLIEEDLKKRKEEKKNKEMSVKEEKMFSLSSKISENDLNIKINQMIKALKKKHEVRIYISHDGNSSRTAEIVSYIENELKEIAIQKNHASKQTIAKLVFVPKLIDEKDNIESDKKSLKKEVKANDHK